MTSVSLPLLLICSLLISAILAWVNRRGIGVAGAAAATLAACVAAPLIQLTMFGRALSARQDVEFWLLFVLVPGAVVFGASRLPPFQNRPGWLLLAGPLSFLFVVVIVMIAYNVWFVSNHPG